MRSTSSRLRRSRRSRKRGLSKSLGQSSTRLLGKKIIGNVIEIPERIDGSSERTDRTGRKSVKRKFDI